MSGRRDLRAQRTPLNQRLLLTTTEAAEILGVSRDLFREDIAPDLRPVAVRRRLRWPLSELERWVERQMLSTPSQD